MTVPYQIEKEEDD